jgi:hypothetical protein
LALQRVMVDLYAGSKSASKPMAERGWEVRSVDILWGEDVLTWSWDGGKVDLMWASPPCERFSVAGHFHHFRKVGERAVPVTPDAEYAVALVRRALKLRDEIHPTYFVMENPRGLMRKALPELRSPVTVWYCRYGDERAKPTDLWLDPPAGPPGFLPLRRCRNESSKCAHSRAPRGSPTGTQGRKGLERSAVPYLLALKLCLAVEGQIEPGWRW